MYHFIRYSSDRIEEEEYSERHFFEKADGTTHLHIRRSPHKCSFVFVFLVTNATALSSTIGSYERSNLHTFPSLKKESRSNAKREPDVPENLKTTPWSAALPTDGGLRMTGGGQRVASDGWRWSSFSAGGPRGSDAARIIHSRERIRLVVRAWATFSVLSCVVYSPSSASSEAPFVGSNALPLLLLILQRYTSMTNKDGKSLILVVLHFLLNVHIDNYVDAHGRLMDPPARNSMWRFGFPNPVNYNDNELFCGGYAVQWIQNKGQCGVCGDAYHLNEPRPHEAGGEYAKGTIVRHYTVGQDVDVEVELTANHMGRFELYLCPHNNPSNEATQKCFDRYPLYVSGTRDVRFEIPLDTPKKAIFRYKVTLPAYVTCSQCVIQWTYYTGNMWGTCDNGTEAVGCGQPETFRNCADVSIVTSTAGVPPLFAQQDNPFLLYYRDISAPYSVFPLIIRSQVCVPTRSYQLVPGMSKWCQANCLRYPPNCPTKICQCPEVCDAIGEIAGKEGASVYCMDKCLVYPSNCPTHRCRCY